MAQRQLARAEGLNFTLSPAWMVILALVIGLALRLLWLGGKSLWLDEALSVRLAAAPWQLWGQGFDHSHPPLYYTLLHYWLPLGMSEAALRLSSALVGSLAIPLSYWLADYLGGRRSAYTAVWLVALSPLLVWYAQELRSYSLLMVWGLVAALALARLVTHPRIGWWLLFVLAMSAACYTHYAALLLIPIQLGIIALLSLQQRVLRGGVWLWLAAWPVVMLLYWPWLTAPGMAAFSQMFIASNLYPIEFLALQLGVSSSLAGTLLVVGGMLGIVVLGMIAILVLRRGLPRGQSLVTARWVRYGVLLLFLLLTIFAVAPRLYTVKKMVIALWPYGLLIVAWFFPWKAANRVAIGLLLIVSLAGSLVNVAFVPKDQWRMLAAYINAHDAPGDMIWVVPSYQSVALNYYLAQADDAGEGAKVLSGAASMSEAELAELTAGGARVWLIYHAADVDLADPNRQLQTWLDAHMTRQDAFHPFRIDAWLYAPRP